VLSLSSFPPALVPLAIFLLRAADLTLGTVRMLSVARGRKPQAWLLGFLQALLFITVVSGLFSSLQSPLNLAAYAAGFASGTVVGMALESRLAPGHSLLRIFSRERGVAVCDALRQSGWGATDIAGRGKDGAVSLILVNIRRREVEAVRRAVVSVDPSATITVEQVRQMRGGWRA